jgi:hypothetical protein
MAAIAHLKQKFGGSSLFANEKDNSFKSSIATIYQTFDGIELYPIINVWKIRDIHSVTNVESFRVTDTIVRHPIFRT